MYVYGLCLLFDFATKNLHFATVFYHLVDKCDLRILLISSPELYITLCTSFCTVMTSRCNEHLEKLVDSSDQCKTPTSSS